MMTAFMQKDSDIDENAICENFISITPIKCDMTDYAMDKELKAWNIDGWER